MLIPASPQGLPTSRTSWEPAFWTKTPHLWSPTALALAHGQLSSFKLTCTISQEPKLITDFKTQSFQGLSICYSIFKGYKGQTSPPSEAGALESRSQCWARDCRECWFNPPRKACKASVDAPAPPQPWGNGTLRMCLAAETWRSPELAESDHLILHEGPETYTWDAASSDSKRKLVRTAVRHPAQVIG